VELHATRLKSAYLAWIYDLGQLQCAGAPLVQALQLREGLSYWWMTAPAQRFNASGVSPVHDCIKLLALEELLAGRRASRLTLNSSNRVLRDVVEEFCVAAGIEFTFSDMGTAATAARKSWRRFVPLPVQAAISLVRHVAHRWRAVRAREPAWFADAQATFIDVLVHLDASAHAGAGFASNYWTSLVASLTSSHARTNWLHHYFKHAAVPRFADAQRLAESFNAAARDRERHALIDDAIGVMSVGRAIADFLRLAWRSATVRPDCGDWPRAAGSRMNLWRLHRDEWRESMRGPTAIINCLGIACIEHIVGRMPRQRRGFFIQENQPWEFALIHFWNRGGHGELIGVPHSTVRYWDLRYFYDARTFAGNQPGALPRPHKVAVNGPVAMQSYVEGGYPPAEMVEVEALRYMHIAERRSRNPPASPARRVLVCGDFLPSTSRRMLDWLTQALQELGGENFRLTYKPHPAYAVELSRYAGLRMQITSQPLGQLLDDCDVILASNITSAVVDAFYRCVPVIQMLDGESFNFSPLRGKAGVTYVASATELAQALQRAQPAQTGESPQYFYLERELPRWRSLLQLP
jgi:surface carbohydrate biosynthesis protein (TIGR04326 family)